MKIDFDFKNKKAKIDADVEKIVTKGMEQNEKDWKNKFDTKHNAKKEMLEIKHKQKMETEEQKEKKKNWFQKIAEEKRKAKELEIQLEIEEKRLKAEEEKRMLKLKINATIILSVVGSIFLILGYLFGSMSYYGDPGWDGLLVVGFFTLMSIVFIWVRKPEKEIKKNKKRKK